jgi:hypothetical protein
VIPNRPISLFWLDEQPVELPHHRRRLRQAKCRLSLFFPDLASLVYWSSASVASCTGMECELAYRIRNSSILNVPPDVLIFRAMATALSTVEVRYFASSDARPVAFAGTCQYSHPSTLQHPIGSTLLTRPKQIVSVMYSSPKIFERLVRQISFRFYIIKLTPCESQWE